MIMTFPYQPIPGNFEFSILAMDLLVSDHIGQVHRTTPNTPYISLTSYTGLRIFSDAKKEVERTLWFPVPQPLEPIQQMLALPNDPTHRVLLYRRTGIVQVARGKEEAEVLGAARIAEEEKVGGAECLQLWAWEGRMRALLSDGQLWDISVDEENQISFKLAKQFSIGADPLTASSVTESHLALGSKSLLPVLYSLGDLDTPVFTAKRPRPNKLGQPVKADVRSILHMPETKQLVCGLASGQVWVYELEGEGLGQPSIQKELHKVPITGLYAFGHESILACNSRGACEAYDLVNLMRTGGYLGNNGAVTQALLQPSLLATPTLVTGSMERFVTVYHGATRKALHKVHLGHQPQAFLLQKLVKEAVKEGDDKLWAQMKRVKEE